MYGKEQFLAFYASTLCFSSLASLSYKYWLSRRAFSSSVAGSVGASGALYGLLGVLWHLPGLRVSLIFLPGIQIPLQVATAGLAVFDLVGMARGLQVFDHAAHLGGLAFGWLYHTEGRQWFWSKREQVLESLGLLDSGNNSRKGK